MASDLSFVNEAGNGWVIYRETIGSYVVGFQQKPNQWRNVPTLACAYATRQDQGAEACGDTINSLG
jgi:hypothetical protein